MSAAEIIAKHGTPNSKQTDTSKLRENVRLSDQSQWIDGIPRESIENWVNTVTEWMETVEQMTNPTPENIFECLGVATLFGPNTRNALMLTLALDFGNYLIRPDLVNEKVLISTQTTSTVSLHVVRECWFLRPGEITVDLVKCDEILRIMRHIPYLRNVMRMMDEVGYTLTGAKLPHGCTPDWREQIVRYNVTPQSGMLDPSENLLDTQVITGVISQFSVINSTRGTEKYMGWFYKEQFLKHILYQRNKMEESGAMIDEKRLKTHST